MSATGVLLSVTSTPRPLGRRRDDAWRDGGLRGGFVLLAVTVTGLDRRVGWSAPILLVTVGAAVSFRPGIPRVRMEPEFVLYGVLPPLLFAAPFAFAAVVAPTDASAVAAIADRLELPRRVVTVLEGESLLNDATALVLLHTAIVAIISTTGPALIAADLVHARRLQNIRSDDARYGRGL